MIDPRAKKPTTSDLIDTRHQEWMKSLRVERVKNQPMVIKLRVDKWGKTAEGLSERELEVLQLVSFGNSSAKVADKLCISTHTVTNHRKNMLSRSRCGNLAELVRVAIKENLL